MIFRHIPWFLLLVTSGLLGAVVTDQNKPLENALQPPELRFNVFSTDKGLSQSTVYSMVRDQDGFLWFGTEDGLNKYDGYSIKVYRNQPGNPRSLLNNLVVDMVLDLDGRIWLATDAGVGRYNAETDDFDTFQLEKDPTKTLSQQISAMAVQGRDYIWISGFRGGLYRLNLKTLRYEEIDFDPSRPERLAGNWVRALAVEPSGHVWMGSIKGLNRYDPVSGQWDLFEHNPSDPNSISNNQIRTLFLDSHNQLWVGTINGLNLLDRDTGKFRRFTPENTPGLVDGWINVIGEDHLSRIWIGCRSGGLAYYDKAGEQFVTYRHNAGLPYSIGGDNILCFLVDPSGIMWVGGYLSGVSSAELNPKPFGLYHAWSDGQNHLSDGRVRAVMESKRGDLWVGTMNGLNRLSKEERTFKAFLPDADDPNSISETQVMSMAEEHDGSLWFGTYYGGVCRLDPGAEGFAVYRSNPDDPTSLPHDVVASIELDAKGRVWFGTRFGLGMYRESTDDFRQISLLPEGLEDKISPEVYVLAHDGDQTLWAGTDASGIFAVNDETGAYRRFIQLGDDPNTLPTNAIHSLLLAGDDKIWVGTPVGLCQLDIRSGHVTRYDHLPQIGSSNIRGVLFGNPDEIWLSTNHGLIQFNTAQMTTRAFDFHDGLQGNEFIRGAYFRSPEGRLYFGGTLGLSYFFPGGLEKRRYLPDTAITSMEVYGKEQIFAKRTGNLGQVSLQPYQRYFSLEFAALDFARPDKNRHAYQLVGFDDNWVEAGSRRFISYSNLAPGDYHFQVKGTNSDGFWSDRVTQLEITVLPPFWATWWFRGLAFALIVGGLISAHLLRVRHVAHRARELQMQVEVQTAELAHAQGELLEMARKAGMAEISTGVLHNIGNLFNSVNVAVESLHSRYVNSKIARLSEAVILLEENKDRLPAFFEPDDKGPVLAKYLIHLSDIIKRESAGVGKEISHLQESVGLIREEISSQQEYAGAANPLEEVYLADFLKDALIPFETMFSVFGVTARVVCEDKAAYQLPRARVLNVLGLLIRNAEEAMHDSERRELVLEGRYDPSMGLVIRVCDTGPGIPPELQERIFGHGFSTRGNRGVGLHTCANTMRELGGHLRLVSESGGGAVFELSLPGKSNP